MSDSTKAAARRSWPWTVILACCLSALVVTWDVGVVLIGLWRFALYPLNSGDHAWDWVLCLGGTVVLLPVAALPYLLLVRREWARITYSVIASSAVLYFAVVVAPSGFLLALLPRFLAVGVSVVLVWLPWSKPYYTRATKPVLVGEPPV